MRKEIRKVQEVSLFIKLALGALGKRCSRESQELLESLGILLETSWNVLARALGISWNSLGNFLESLDMALGGLLEPLGRTLARLLPRHLSGVLKSLAKVP
jgi:hypothetical protein